MAITAIGRYFVGDPNIVSIVTTDDLATITTTGYLTTQEDEIELLQNGEFQWTITDLALIYYATDQIGFFRYDAVNNTFDALNPSGGLADTLQNGNIFVGNAGNIATGVTPSGDITLSNTGVFGIAAGVIVNADVNASAAIALTKLAALPSAEILVGSAGNAATAVAMTGDIAITNTGVTSIQAGAIVNADVNAAAAIDFSKLAVLSSANILVGSVGGVATSVAMTGDVTISNTGVTSIAALSIVNADISASAAIAFSKLATLATGHIIAGNGGVATDVTVSGDVTIGATGITAIGAGKVVLAMLATGITPSAVIKFNSQVTTTGGSPTEAFVVTGALAASDRAFVQVVNNGTNDVTVLQAVVTNDTLTITFSGDPSNDTVLNYQLIRAAA